MKKKHMGYPQRDDTGISTFPLRKTITRLSHRAYIVADDSIATQVAQASATKNWPSSPGWGTVGRPYCEAPGDLDNFHPNPFNSYGISCASVLSPIGTNDEPLGR